MILLIYQNILANERKSTVLNREHISDCSDDTVEENDKQLSLD